MALVKKTENYKNHQINTFLGTVCQPAYIERLENSLWDQVNRYTELRDPTTVTYLLFSKIVISLSMVIYDCPYE